LELKQYLLLAVQAKVILEHRAVSEIPVVLAEMVMLEILVPTAKLGLAEVQVPEEQGVMLDQPAILVMPEIQAAVAVVAVVEEARRLDILPVVLRSTWLQTLLQTQELLEHLHRLVAQVVGVVLLAQLAGLVAQATLVLVEIMDLEQLRVIPAGLEMPEVAHLLTGLED
jgi:hypothetical protein